MLQGSKLELHMRINPLVAAAFTAMLPFAILAHAQDPGPAAGEKNIALHPEALD
jgi:hypothetical protein